MADHTDSSSRPAPRPPEGLAGDAHGLVTHLAPALSAHTGGRLSRVQWFRSSHQRGGAATGMAEFRREDGSTQPVVVKVPVGPAEYRWTTGLSGRRAGGSTGHAPTPGVLAHGVELGGYDLAWMVLERLKGQTLHHGWSRESAEDLLLACARFQAEAEALAPVAAARETTDWERLIARAREVARQSALPEAQHWNESVKRVQRALPHLLGLWNGRPINAWCHGDLHPGNAMHRDGVDGASGREPCVLIDLALVHAGHWVEDAVYLERQFWARPEGLFGVHPVSVLARYRRELGLKTEGDYGLVANVRRVLMAACAPVHLVAEGNPKYVHAALETIDRVLPMVAHAH